jgi:hypothetical protein
MKNIFRIILGIFLLSALTTQISWSQHLPEVIALRNLKLKDSINHTEFQNFYDRWCDQVMDNARGVCAWIMQGDRGDRKSNYTFVWGFDFKCARDYYFPQSEIANYPQWNSLLQSFRFQAPISPMVDSIIDYTDFIVLGYNEMINPRMGEVFSIRFPDIIEGKEPDFEKFVIDEFHNAFQENVDGMYIYVLKGDRGTRMGKYMVVTVFDSVVRRNLYFPKEGESLSVEGEKQWETINLKVDKLNTFIAEGSMDHYTDYIVIY